MIAMRQAHLAERDGYFASPDGCWLACLASLVQDFVQIEELVREHRPRGELGFGELRIDG